MTFVLAHWRILLVRAALALAGAVVGVSRHQVAKCRAELVEYRHAYDTLAASVQRQNEAVNEWERKATEAQQRAATARREASGAAEVAKRSADALAGAMVAPRPAECPTKGAVDAVRADLAGR